MIEILKGIHETVNFDYMRGVKVYNNVEYENYPPHWHNAIEMIFPLENDYTVKCGEVLLSMNPGDIFVCPPGELHTLFAPESGRRFIIQIDYSLLCNLIGMEELVQLLRPYRLIKSETEPHLAQQLGNQLMKIHDEYFSARPFKESCIYAHFIRFFVELGRARVDADSIFPNITAGKQLEYCEKFMSICRYINEHCTEALTIDQISKIAGFSKFHFCRLFKQFTGTSFYDYWMGKKVAYVETLLIDPNISITDIAMQAGFNSISTFNRIFKQHKQCSPTQYRAFLWNC